MRIDDQVMEKLVRQRGFHVYVIPTDEEKMIAEHTVKHVDRAAC
jgi:acetate kinase